MEFQDSYKHIMNPPMIVKPIPITNNNQPPQPHREQPLRQQPPRQQPPRQYQQPPNQFKKNLKRIHYKLMYHLLQKIMI